MKARTTIRSGRRPGASGTREAILSVARRQFAQYGYDRAVLRRIAAEARVDQKLIAHFFESKQQLFVAAIGLPFNPAEMLPSIVASDPASRRDRIAGLLAEILQHPELHERLTAVVRAAASEPAAARMMREFLTSEVMSRTAAVLGGDDARLRVSLAGSQIVGLVMARYVVAVEPLASTAHRVVADTIAGTLEGYLFGPLGSQPINAHRAGAEIN
ncbi:MAG: TetR family transcriptional regulator [Candidatus Dormibacteraceae bacterium]